MTDIILRFWQSLLLFLGYKKPEKLDVRDVLKSPKPIRLRDPPRTTRFHP